jgi:hypothetical protein
MFGSIHKFVCTFWFISYNNYGHFTQRRVCFCALGNAWVENPCFGDPYAVLVTMVNLDAVVTLITGWNLDEVITESDRRPTTCSLKGLLTVANSGVIGFVLQCQGPDADKSATAVMLCVHYTTWFPASYSELCTWTDCGEGVKLLSCQFSAAPFPLSRNFASSGNFISLTDTGWTGLHSTSLSLEF